MLRIVFCQCSWKYKSLIFWSNNSIGMNILARVNKTKHKNKLGYYYSHFLKKFFICMEIFSTPSLSVCMCLKWVSCSVQFSHSVVSNSLWPHGLQHARPSCPSPTPGVYPNSCPLNRWCHPAISSSVIPFSSHLQSFPASGSFQMSQLFTSGGQSIGVSASTSVLPMNIQGWSPIGWTGGSPCSPRDSQESSPTPQFKSINSSALSFLYSPTLTSIHDHWKNHSLD